LAVANMLIIARCHQ